MKQALIAVLAAMLLAAGLAAQDTQPDDKAAAGGNAAATETVDPATLPPPDITQEIPADKLKTFEKKNADGIVVTRYTYYDDQYGRKIKHGTYEEFYDDGTKSRELTYKHGKPDGRQRWWHTNGALWMDFKTKMGVRDGTYQEFWRNGKRKRLLVYEDGKIARRQ